MQFLQEKGPQSVVVKAKRQSSGTSTACLRAPPDWSRASSAQKLAPEDSGTQLNISNSQHGYSSSLPPVLPPSRPPSLLPSSFPSLSHVS